MAANKLANPIISWHSNSQEICVLWSPFKEQPPRAHVDDHLYFPYLEKSQTTGYQFLSIWWSCKPYHYHTSLGSPTNVKDFWREDQMVLLQLGCFIFSCFLWFQMYISSDGNLQILKICKIDQFFTQTLNQKFQIQKLCLPFNTISLKIDNLRQSNLVHVFNLVQLYEVSLNKNSKAGIIADFCHISFYFFKEKPWMNNNFFSILVSPIWKEWLGLGSLPREK